MSGQNTVAGVVLAGGLARRMGQRDKGLVLFKNRPLAAYAVEAMAQVADTVLISANRNQDSYRQFGYPVIGDASSSFDGPLAGILSALRHVDAEILLAMPCDSPLLEARHLQRLLNGRVEAGVDIAVAFDGERIHPVFLALSTALRADLQAYLQQGERRVEAWLRRHSLVEVDFSVEPRVFANVNTPDELAELERGGG